VLGELAPEKALQLAFYRDLILTWNQKFNLTGLRTGEAVDSRLILESIRLVECIRGRIEQPLDGLSLIDIGAGAGIPGIPISILDPGVEVLMV